MAEQARLHEARQAEHRRRLAPVGMRPVRREVAQAELQVPLLAAPVLRVAQLGSLARLRVAQVALLGPSLPAALPSVSQEHLAPARWMVLWAEPRVMAQRVLRR